MKNYDTQAIQSKGRERIVSSETCGQQNQLGKSAGGFSEKTKARFWSKVQVKGPDECWEWVGDGASRGKHCRIKIERVILGSHRVAWMLTNGNIQNGMCVCHTCDNPPCCNPSHLWIGTTADNMRDKMIKGRAASGDKNGMRLHPELVSRGESNAAAKLKEGDIPFIRNMLASGISMSKIAKVFGVSTFPIYDIKRGNAWRHVSI